MKSKMKQVKLASVMYFLLNAVDPNITSFQHVIIIEMIHKIAYIFFACQVFKIGMWSILTAHLSLDWPHFE